MQKTEPHEIAGRVPTPLHCGDPSGVAEGPGERGGPV